MKVEKRDNVTILSTGHRLDGTNGSKLTDLIKELARESSLKLVIDMGRTNLINRSGSKAIEASLMVLLANQGDMKIARPTSKTLEVFQRHQLHKVLEIHDTLESAVKSFS